MLVELKGLGRRALFWGQLGFRDLEFRGLGFRVVQDLGVCALGFWVLGDRCLYGFGEGPSQRYLYPLGSTS